MGPLGLRRRRARAQARPRRPHANRLPAPTPLPPRGGRRAGSGNGGGDGRGGGARSARGASRPPAGRSGRGGARVLPTERPAARRGPAAAAAARRLRAPWARRHPRGAAPARSRGARRRASRRLQGPGRPAAGRRAPDSRIPTQRSARRAALLGGSSARPGAGCTCSSAGPQPTLGRQPRRETNPSAARPAGRPTPSRRRRHPRVPLRRAARRHRRPGRGRTELGSWCRPARCGGMPNRRRGCEIAPARLAAHAWGGEAGTAAGMPGDAPTAGGGCRRALAAARVLGVRSRGGRAGLEAERRLPPTPNGGCLMRAR